MNEFKNICKNCGASLDEEHLFCPKCGTKIDTLLSQQPIEENESYEQSKDESIQEEITTKKPNKNFKINKNVIIIITGIILATIIVSVIYAVIQKNNRIESNNVQLQTAQKSYDNGDYQLALNAANSVLNNKPTVDQQSNANKIIDNSKKKQEEERKKQEAEKKKQEEERKAARKEEIKNAFQVTGLWLNGPDSAQGYEVYFNYINHSDKTVNYVNFAFEFYNAVGDKVTTGTGIASVNYCVDVGPFGPGEGRQGDYWHWGKYYNSTINSINLVELSIEYSDGSKLTLTKDEIPYVIY